MISLSNVLSRLLPARIKRMLKKIWLLSITGRRFYCPICERGFRKFYQYGVKPRPNAQCPCCGSLERHRLLWVALCKLQRQNRIFDKTQKLLHVAPEDCLAEIFAHKYEYFSVDLEKGKAMIAMDITKMSFENEIFDAIVCNHVLEHIPDDRNAIKELYRVLKHGGWASIQVPIKGNITQEDVSIKTPKERLCLYGQEDHVRSYGRDFIDRLKVAGFEVLLISKESLLSPKELERISVDFEKEVIICKK